MASTSVRSLTLAQSGATRTINASWNAPTFTERLKTYKIKWVYYKDGLWFTGKNWTDNGLSPKTSSYTAPDDATAVKIYVKPEYNKYKVNGVETQTAGTSECAKFRYSTAVPSAPSSVSVEQAGSASVIVSVSGLNNVADHVVFEMGTATKTVYKTVIARTDEGSASAKFAPPAGMRVRFRAKSRNIYDNGKKTVAKDSDYTDWTDYEYYSAPKEVSISKLTVGETSNGKTVRIDWNASSGQTGYEIQYATKKSYLGTDQCSSATQTQYATRQTVNVSESGITYYFRIRATNSIGSSSWSNVASVVVGSVPDVPTVFSSHQIATIGQEDPVYLYIVHNASDGSDCTGIKLYFTSSYYIHVYLDSDGDVAYEESERANRPTWMTNSVYEDLTGYIVDHFGDTEIKARINFSNFPGETSIYWWAKTAGISGTYSGNSATQSIKVYREPVLTTAVPAEINAYPVDVRATVTNTSAKIVSTTFSVYNSYELDMTNQYGEEITIAADTLIAQKTTKTKTDTYGRISETSFGINSLNLANNTEYYVKTTVILSNGLTCEDTVYFETAFEDVDFYTRAVIGINTDELYAEVVPKLRFTGDLTENYYLDLYRINVDGTYTHIGRTTNSRTTFIDPHPALDFARYRVVATLRTRNQIGYTDIDPIPVGCKEIVIQWDEEIADGLNDENEDELDGRLIKCNRVRLPYNISVTEQSAKDASMVQYIGRSEPVAYYGTQKGYSASWSCVIPESDVDTLNAVRALQAYMGTVYVREPSGTGYNAHVDVSLNRQNKTYYTAVTFTITKVEGDA